ncbi:MAG: alpha/beta fold hydrolase [Pseudomonadota bacterium]
MSRAGPVRPSSSRAGFGYLLVTLALTLSNPAAGTAQPVDPCGPALCETELGSYRAALPDGPAPEAGHPALLFLHGAARSGADVLARRAMVETFRDAGYAVIAPDGLPRPDVRDTRGWFFLPEGLRVRLRDDAAFVAEVVADAAARHGVDPDRVALGGYSIGGSMAWWIACREPETAAAYVPVAGAFWEPQPAPTDCAGPVRMLHTHGWRDRTVPLEGRPLRGGALYQGDVFASLRTLRVVNGCDARRADEIDTADAFWRRDWTECASGSALSLALHSGGHVVPDEWAAMAVEWLATAMPPR